MRFTHSTRLTSVQQLRRALDSVLHVALRDNIFATSHASRIETLRDGVALIPNKSAD